MDNIYPKIDGYKARDYGSRDSGLSLFFLPAVRRVPENRIPEFGDTRVPWSRTSAARDPRGTATSAPGHRGGAGGAMGVAATVLRGS